MDDTKDKLELMLSGYEKAAATYERKADDLIAQYGTGSRPSWVSGEVGIAMALAAQYRVRAEEMRRHLDKL